MKPIKGQQKKGKITRKTSLNNRGLSRKLWDQAPFACHLLNTKGIITSVNQTEARLLGYKKRSWSVSQYLILFCPSNRPKLKKSFSKS